MRRNLQLGKNYPMGEQDIGLRYNADMAVRRDMSKKLMRLKKQFYKEIYDVMVFNKNPRNISGG